MKTRLMLAVTLLALTAPVSADDAVQSAFHFPPPGESLANQLRRNPSEVGLRQEIVERIEAKMPTGRWALWRHGYLVHVNGDFNETTEVKSLRKTWHALTVGAAIQQGRIPSISQKLSVYCKELSGKDTAATWRHVIAQTSAFDYPYGDHPAHKPGDVWTYSDKNPRHLCNAIARVYGRKDYRDRYEDVVRAAYFDAIGMRGWKTSVRGDGVRFHLDLEDMGRLGLLVLARGSWNGKQLIPASFIEQLETKQTRGAKVNYNGPDDGRVGLDPKQFPEAPYGFMTWVNTDGDYYPGADRGWAWGAGAGGSCVLWNREYGIVFAGFGVDTRPTSDGIPHAIESCIRGDNPLSR
jgi:hypothetical protein